AVGQPRIESMADQEQPRLRVDHPRRGQSDDFPSAECAGRPLYGSLRDGLRIDLAQRINPLFDGRDLPVGQLVARHRHLEADDLLLPSNLHEKVAAIRLSRVDELQIRPLATGLGYGVPDEIIRRQAHPHLRIRPRVTSHPRTAPVEEVRDTHLKLLEVLGNGGPRRRPARHQGYEYGAVAQPELRQTQQTHRITDSVDA